ncbi:MULTISPECIES: CRISPR-associated endonuclease Cas1 [unclassified Nostoc]|uniref:CRISPR-associated endonuclease Cas1 n=1 Tax=unclassified Nostoc TaxID=2593658 RepID=UPI002AD3BECB|nr:CRISPR-associated endonuclease Cas1 [Nostoc sp. DedQUE03]MDZ7973427.1 CRISPR-associated endonuclease Cas1 [Nostoc sp. DedQUE03]MDZ8045298.1 CRISPR-associated endonuclease Cas1 [Nostoc sp. DedQUE02]
MSTIYITEQDVTFQIQHHYLKVFHQQNQRICIPIRNLSQFIIFGNISLPKEVIQIVHSHQIPVLYLTQTGEYLGRLENPSQLQAKYLTSQRRRTRDTEFNRATAESIIWAKLHNQHTFLQSWTRHHANHTTQRALNYLTLLMDNLPIAPGIDELHEYSEEADNIYYCAVASLITFYNEYPRTTAKRISQLINLGNQLLHQYIYTLLKTAGLDPNYAILHRDSHQELPLAWDFTAEFSTPIVDDLVLNFVRNLTNTNGNGNGNGKSQSQKLLQKFLQYWEAKLRTFVLHPYAGEVSYRQCLDLQVREYLASLLGDVEFYRPLALKFRPASEVKSKKLKGKREEEDEVKSQKLKIRR